MLSEYSLFLWLGWQLSVEELVEKWSNLLPAAIKIINADLANLDPRLNLKNHSVYFANSIERDERVWMSCDEGIHLSIPLSCPILFHHIDNYNSSLNEGGKLIRELVKEDGFAGTKIKVLDPLDELAAYGELQFLNTYIATYLNVIPLNAAGDILTSAGQIFLPTYYKIIVDVAQPLTNQILKNKFLNISSNIKSSTTHSNFKQEIVIFQDKIEDEYDLIPRVTKHSFPTDSFSHLSNNKISPPLPARRRHHTYNNQIKHFSNLEIGNDNIPNSHQARSIHQSLKKVSENQSKASSINLTNSQISLTSPKKNYKGNNTSNHKSPAKFATLLKRLKFKNKKDNFNDNVFQDQDKGSIKFLNHNEANKLSPNEDTYDKIGSPSFEKRLLRYSSQRDLYSISQVTNDVNLVTRLSKSEDDLVQTIPYNADSIEEIYEYPVAKKQHSLLTLTKSSEVKGELKSTSLSIKSKACNINIVEVEWPDDVSVLSVEEVGRYLHLLHLGVHESEMAKEQVDGRLLQSLNESILCSQFNMRRIDALKLVLFANHNWRPKL